MIYSYSKEGSPIALKRDQCFKLVCEKLPFIFSIKSIRKGYTLSLKDRI